ncbi:MAG TPA: glycoside hydrolase family 97 protein [Candidatus Acidoferrum sp.]|jgi:alpha-glucosidase|nr:glycoside hydrolase family 97 protein [Candidatus Acidoferrum sp.]
MATSSGQVSWRFGLTLCLATCWSAISASPERDRGGLSLRSPDGKIEVTVAARGRLTYSVQVDNQAVLQPSRLGFEFSDGASLGSNVELSTTQRRGANSAWENKWGKRREVRDRYNELRLALREVAGVGMGRNFEVEFRAYDDGVAFRYVLPAQAAMGAFLLRREPTEFCFAGDYQCFAGQQEKGFQGAQEWEFKPGRLSEIKPEAIVGLPLLVQTPAAWVAVFESDLRDWAGMWLGGGTVAAGGVTLDVKLAPRPDGQGLVKAAPPHASPWRVLMIGREPGRLLESDLVLNLSTPCLLADTSWIRPGKMAWDHWWSGDVEMKTSTLKDYIELAAEMGWPYQLIDWQWYGSFNKPNSDITKVSPSVDMEEVRRFAKEKGVRLLVWLYWSDVDRNDAYKKAFALYEEWGMAGVKIDFMDRDDQEMVNWYEKITKAAAEHHLMVNFHGAFKTSGFNRTFPNQITREGILGNEYNRWSTRVTPEHKVTLPFTRFLAGPADFTPGGFLNRQPSQFKPDSKAAQVQGTRAAELALFVVYDSPLCCVCDHPSHYGGQAGAGFLKIVPTVWDDTRALDAEVAKHVVVARRSGQEWFLGGLTGSGAYDASVSLAFLKKGRWRLRLWRDATDSDVNGEHLEIEERVVTAQDVLKIHCAPAGGLVAWLRRE